VNTVVDKMFVASGLGAKNQASEDRCYYVMCTGCSVVEL